MIVRALPALLLALALPAAAAPNRPPADNTYCATNDTTSWDALRVTFTISPTDGSAPLERTLDVPRGQSPCFVTRPGRVSIAAAQSGMRPCRASREASEGQVRVAVRVSTTSIDGFNSITPALACGE